MFRICCQLGVPNIGPARLERARLVAAVRQRDLGAALIAFEHDERRVDEQGGLLPP